MQDYVSLQTGIKLKEAGFPQPEIFTMGHVFYLKYYSYTEKKHVYTIDPTCLADRETYRNHQDDVFAPRVTDIMLHLPEGCELQMETQHGEPNPMWYMFPPSDWVYENEGKYIGPEGNENPAEAAAQMWIKLKEQ